MSSEKYFFHLKHNKYALTDTQIHLSIVVMIAPHTHPGRSHMGHDYSHHWWCPWRPWLPRSGWHRSASHSLSSLLLRWQVYTESIERKSQLKQRVWQQQFGDDQIRWHTTQYEKGEALEIIHISSNIGKQTNCIISYTQKLYSIRNKWDKAMGINIDCYYHLLYVSLLIYII